MSAENAEPLYLQTLEISQAMLGKDRPNTKLTPNNYNHCLMIRSLSMPEAEIRKVLSEEAREEPLKYKWQLEAES